MNSIIQQNMPVIDYPTFRERVQSATGFKKEVDLIEFNLTMSEAGMVKESDNRTVVLGNKQIPISRSAYDKNIRNLMPGEDLQQRNHRSDITYFKTQNKLYKLHEKGESPVWRTCIYEVNEGVEKLIDIPKNCQFWSSLQVYASNKSPYLLIQDGPGGFVPAYPNSNYIVEDGKIIYLYNHK